MIVRGNGDRQPRPSGGRRGPPGRFQENVDQRFRNAVLHEVLHLLVAERTGDCGPRVIPVEPAGGRSDERLGVQLHLRASLRGMGVEGDVQDRRFVAGHDPIDTNSLPEDRAPQALCEGHWADENVEPPLLRIADPLQERLDRGIP